MFSQNGLTCLRILYPLSRVQPVFRPNQCCRTFAKKERKYKKRIDTEKLSSDVVNYISSPVFDEIRDLIPNYLLKKYRNPPNTYLVNPKTAQEIVNKCGDKLTKDDVIVEINPGIGVLTEKLLQMYENDIYLFETQSMYKSAIKELQDKYPGRLHYKVGDFFEMWKLVFLDKQDNGTRLQELLGQLTNDSKGKTIKILGSMPGLNFIKHLIFIKLFQSETHPLGRPELYVVTSGQHVPSLSDTGTLKGKGYYKVFPAMFKIMFHIEIIDKFNRADYLPWSYNSVKASLRDDYDKLYLVRIVHKDGLACEEKYLPLLWYFFKTQISSRSNRVIPGIEQWIPGAGVWLITGQDPPHTNKELAPGPEDEPLPHMTVFTMYKDLTLGQIITVFKRFISWPDFEQCPFRLTMEQNLPRSLALMDEKEIDTESAAVAEDSDSGSDAEDEKPPE